MSNFLIDEDTDLLAAEFVLGTLDSEERANAQSLLRTDHGFIAMVRIWERRFGELHLMVEPVEPDAKILQRIKAKIAELPRASRPPTASCDRGDGEPGRPRNRSADAGQCRNAQPPADGSAPVAALQPQDSAATGTTQPPAEIAVAGGGREAAGTGRRPRSAGHRAGRRGSSDSACPGWPQTQPAAVEVQPEPEPRSQESVRSRTTSRPQSSRLPPPPALPKPSIGRKPESRPVRRPEIIIDVIRSRGRWRVAGSA